MLVLGGMLLVWGIAFLLLARPLHDNWREMIRRLRGAGYARPPFGTRFIASPSGLRALRITGGCGVIAGAVLLLLGWYRR